MIRSLWATHTIRILRDPGEGRTLAGQPGADHSSHRRHQEQLPDQHLQDGEGLPWVGVRTRLRTRSWSGW
jgi:hypothetical protein